MKLNWHIQPFHIAIIFLLVNMTVGNPIESNEERDQPFSTALKNSAGAGSADSSLTNDNNMRYLRQFVGRLLRALSSTLKNYPASSLSELASSFNDKAEKRLDKMPATFRFPDETSAETRGQPKFEFQPSDSLSSRTARLAFDGSRYSGLPGVRTGADGRPIRMGTVERVARPNFATNDKQQQQSTNFDIPSSMKSRDISFSPQIDTAASKLVTATSQIAAAASTSRFNETRQIKYGKPSTIQSQPLFVTDGPRDGKRGRSLKTINVQGVKIIVGERVPDAPEDKFFTWRNARVIKGHLVPNDSADSKGLLNENRYSRG